MFEVRQTAAFSAWIAELGDEEAQARILVAVRKVALGNLGKHRRLTKTVSELKIDFGPGYRVYFTKRGPIVVILLCGGDKRTQDADIRKAMKLADKVLA
jgi:putative addiction module killer protein